MIFYALMGKDVLAHALFNERDGFLLRLTWRWNSRAPEEGLGEKFGLSYTQHRPSARACIFSRASPRPTRRETNNGFSLPRSFLHLWKGGSCWWRPLLTLPWWPRWVAWEGEPVRSWLSENAGPASNLETQKKCSSPSELLENQSSS